MLATPLSFPLLPWLHRRSLHAAIFFSPTRSESIYQLKSVSVAALNSPPTDGEWSCPSFPLHLSIVEGNCYQTIHRSSKALIQIPWRDYSRSRRELNPIIPHCQTKIKRRHEKLKKFKKTWKTKEFKEKE